MILLAIMPQGPAPVPWRPRGWQHHLTHTGSRRPLDHMARRDGTPARWCVTCAGNGLVRDAATMVPDACPTCGGTGAA